MAAPEYDTKDYALILTPTLVTRAKADGWFMHDVALYMKLSPVEVFAHPNTGARKYFLRYIAGEAERMTHAHADALMRR